MPHELKEVGINTETENRTPMDRVSEREAEKEKLAEEAEERIRTGAHWTDWMFVADGLAVGQAKAMRAAGTNRPYGREFTRQMGIWLKAPPVGGAHRQGNPQQLFVGYRPPLRDREMAGRSGRTCVPN